MNWSTIIPLLLQVVVWLIKNKLDDNQQKQLGYDQAFKEFEAFIDERRKIAQQIDEDAARWSDADVHDRLQSDGLYRQPSSTVPAPPTEGDKE